MRRIYLVLLFFLPLFAQAQEYTVQNCTYSLLTPQGAPTNLVLGDDVVSAPIDMGFNFPFYGREYRRVYISSNGFLSFENPQTSGCCSGQNLPTNFANTIIAFAWDDLYTDDGVVEYYTLGQMPNRTFVLEFSNVGHCCANSNEVTVQVQLHESGEIRMLSAVNNHAGRFATMGIQDFERGFAAVSGRNGEDWSAAANECYSFTPPCAFIATSQAAASPCEVNLSATISRQPVAVGQQTDEDCIADFSQTGLAQSFTASGNVSCGAAIYLRDGSAAAGSVTIELWDSLPTNPNAQQLAVATVPVAENGAWATVYWAEPVQIITGRRYHLVFSGSSPAQCVAGTLNSSYLGGNSFANNYTSFTGFDYTFRVFGCAQYAWSNGTTTSAQSVGTGGTYNLTVDVGGACALTGSERVTIDLPEVSITQVSIGNFCAPEVALTADVGRLAAVAQEETDGCMSFFSDPIAQSFEATAASSCGAALLLDANGAGFGNLVFELRDSLPNATTSTVLATGLANNVLDGEWALVEWTTIPTLTLGNRYYLVVSSSNANHCAAGSANVNRYAGGNAFAGGGFAPFVNFDFSFRVYACPQYVWSTGATAATLNVDTTGAYSVSVDIGGGCLVSNSENIVLAPYPLTVSATSVVAACGSCVDGSATATPSGATGAVSFLWSNGQTTATATGLQTGTYSATVTDANGCQSSTSVAVGVLSSLGEMGAAAASVQVFPNPTSGEFSLLGLPTGLVRLRVYASTGQLIEQQTRESSTGEPLQITINSMPAGVYLLHVDTEAGQPLARLRVVLMRGE